MAPPLSPPIAIAPPLEKSSFAPDLSSKVLAIKQPSPMPMCPDREASPRGEVILGFTTDELPALLERVSRAGGRVVDPIRAMPELGIRVAFAADPEGHLAELVQLVA